MELLECSFITKAQYFVVSERAKKNFPVEIGATCSPNFLKISYKVHKKFFAEVLTKRNAGPEAKSASLFQRKNEKTTRTSIQTGTGTSG